MCFKLSQEFCRGNRKYDILYDGMRGKTSIDYTLTRLTYLLTHLHTHTYTKKFVCFVLIHYKFIEKSPICIFTSKIVIFKAWNFYYYYYLPNLQRGSLLRLEKFWCIYICMCINLSVTQRSSEKSSYLLKTWNKYFCVTQNELHSFWCMLQ